MTISLIIPVYNAAPYFREAVGSVLSQTMLPKEIILLDDGSTDNSLQIIRKLEKSSSLIKAYTHKNAGPATTRNRGVEYAISEWVCFLDADDILHPQRLEIASYFTKDYDAVICDYARFRGKDTIIYPTFKKNEIDSMSDRDSTLSVLQQGYGLPRMLMKKNSYIKSGGIDESLVNREDHEFHFRMLTKEMKFKKINAPLYYYRQHTGPDRLTQQSSEIMYSYKALYQMIEQIHLLPDQQLQKIASRILADRLANIALKEALQGSGNFEKHLRFAKKIHPNLNPYKHTIHNKISKLVGLGNLEIILGKIKSFIN